MMLKGVRKLPDAPARRIGGTMMIKDKINPITSTARTCRWVLIFPFSLSERVKRSITLAFRGQRSAYRLPAWQVRAVLLIFSADFFQHVAAIRDQPHR
jgi:hypothetical protein